MKTFNGIFFSFLLGGAIGGAVALLYAPQKGKYLRKDISRKTNALIKEGKKISYDSWNDAKEKAENLIENASTKVDTIVRKTEKLKDALKSGLNV